jgi:DNA-binding NtrC family response regulator
MNTYILTTKDLEEVVKTLENAIYKQKLKQFSYDKAYTPNKTEIPLNCLKTALKQYKV